MVLLYTYFIWLYKLSLADFPVIVLYIHGRCYDWTNTLCISGRQDSYWHQRSEAFAIINPWVDC